jgi:hypothetical protein
VVLLLAWLLLVQGLVVAESGDVTSVRLLTQSAGLLILAASLLAGLSIVRQRRSLPLPQPGVLATLHGLVE